jgi:hypothetical protein
MAIDMLGGLFTTPEELKQARMDKITAAETDLLSSDLLTQVAAGGTLAGRRIGERMGSMFGLQTAEEKQAEETQTTLKGLEPNNVDSLTNAINRFKEAGNAKAALYFTEKRDKLVETNLANAQKEEARNAVAAYLRNRGSKALAKAVEGGMDLDKAMAAAKPMEVGGALVAPDTGEILLPAVKKPKTTYRTLSAEEVAKLAEKNPAIDTSFGYQESSDGKLIAMAKTDTTNKYGTIPSGMELVEAVGENGEITAFLRPLPGSKQAKEALENEQAKRTAAQSTAIKTGIINTALTGARDIISSNSSATGVSGALVEDVSKVPFLGALAAGSGRTDLQGHVDTIRANIGFNELKQMKESSTTGASGLGQLAIQEMLALQRTLGDLDLNQSPDKVLQSLDNIEQAFDMAATKMANTFSPDELEQYGLGYLNMYRTREGGGTTKDIITSATVPESIAAKYDIDQATWDMMSPEDRQLLID